MDDTMQHGGGGWDGQGEALPPRIRDRPQQPQCRILRSIQLEVYGYVIALTKHTPTSCPTPPGFDGLVVETVHVRHRYPKCAGQVTIVVVRICTERLAVQ